jgi:hypothetical protein
VGVRRHASVAGSVPDTGPAEYGIQVGSVSRAKPPVTGSLPAVRARLRAPSTLGSERSPRRHPLRKLPLVLIAAPAEPGGRADLHDPHRQRRGTATSCTPRSSESVIERA